MVCVRTPGTPSSKIDRPPISTPGASTRTDRTPILTPGGMSTKTDNYSNGNSNSNSNRTPGGMACKTDRTPGSARMDRTLISTPGTSAKAASAVVGSGRVKEEKIFVTVRVRPLSNKEIAHRDQIAWECQTDNTISFKISASSHDRPNSSYTFDKVFGPTCRTDDVYEKGAKNVALSALTGINATIFAYGQTSSGKTFTMRGITESAVNDIYSHIQNSPERNFTIKMSALEIYNENVRDLLKPDSGPLRLLDDPEKGTVVEKLEEETVKDNKHLRYLIGICEAQRQVGETSLNDTSSRSHQIIRLTIESSLREASDCVQSFLACLNFVDLAGSERVSQTHTEGTRLKEGCHINRSLLTLTTVIRKLSSGKKGGHVPYRDSKLTRILQLSLGGNARTAIICTLSPALSHVEQSRNTLSFATRAKEVTNTAQVNMVISDKKLVKHLQKEVARLEAELRTPELSRTSEELLMEKEMKIKKMEMEMEALKRDRDLAQSQLDELQKKVNIDQPGWNPFESPRRPAKCLTFSGNLPDSNKSRRVDTMRRSMMMRQSSTAPLMLVNEIRKLEHMQEQLGEEAKRALEVLQKEVACHRLGNQDAAETISKLQAEIREMLVVRSLKKDDLVGTNAKGNTEGSSTGATNLKEEITRLHNQGSTIANLEEQLENVQKSLDKLVLSLPNNNNNDETQKSQSKKKEKKKKKMLPLALSNSVNLIRSPCSPHSMMSSRAVAEDENENRNPLDDGDDEDNIYHVALVSGSEKTTTNIPITPSKSEDGNISSRDGTSPCHRRSSSVNVRKMQKMFQNAAEENVRSIKSYVTELKERVAKLQYQKQLLVCQVLELESNETSHDDNNAGDDETITDLQELPEDEESWSSIFKEQRNLIIQLWDVCHVSLIHRTQFYLLFQGDDSSDQIYMEVELRRLTWLQQHFVQSSNEPSSATTNSGADDLQTVTLASSIRALKSEREFLSKRMNSRLSEEEREMLYNKWQIPVYAKQRKLQLACKLWTDPTDPVHIEECAQLVAKLVGFCESGNNMSKAMFELNFALPEGKKPWMLGWNPITNLLRL